MAIDRTWYNSLVDDDGSGLEGSVWDKEDVNQLLNAVDAEFARTGSHPSCYVRRDALQSFPNDTWDHVQYSAPWEAQPASMWSPGNPTGITIPETGHYLALGFVCWDAHPTGVRGVRILRNYQSDVLGAIVINALPADYTVVSSSGVIPCNPGDTISMQAFQRSGAALNAGGRGWPFTNYLQVYKLF